MLLYFIKCWKLLEILKKSHNRSHMKNYLFFWFFFSWNSKDVFFRSLISKEINVWFWQFILLWTLRNHFYFVSGVTKQQLNFLPSIKLNNLFFLNSRIFLFSSQNLRTLEKKLFLFSSDNFFKLSRFHPLIFPRVYSPLKKLRSIHRSITVTECIRQLKANISLVGVYRSNRSTVSDSSDNNATRFCDNFCQLPRFQAFRRLWQEWQWLFWWMIIWRRRICSNLLQSFPTDAHLLRWMSASEQRRLGFDVVSTKSSLQWRTNSSASSIKLSVEPLDSCIRKSADRAPA